MSGQISFGQNANQQCTKHSEILNTIERQAINERRLKKETKRKIPLLMFCLLSVPQNDPKTYQQNDNHHFNLSHYS